MKSGSWQWTLFSQAVPDQEMSQPLDNDLQAAVEQRIYLRAIELGFLVRTRAQLLPKLFTGTGQA
jgi:hypothetical protein